MKLEFESSNHQKLRLFYISEAFTKIQKQVLWVTGTFYSSAISFIYSQLTQFLFSEMQNEPRKPPSHKTFVMGPVTFSSQFDSGNLVLAERQGSSAFNISIGTDHPQNNYRTWFYFSVQGIEPGNTISFNVKNMHNQTRLLNDGLVPVFRNDGQTQWKRIEHPINTNAMFFNNQGFLQFTFKHTFTTQKKVYLAFFYPWSLEQNDTLLKQLEQKAKGMTNIYFHRTLLVNSFEGRPIELVTISSLTKILKQQQQIQEKILFPLKNKPRAFTSDKKAIFISARVHPGEVPSSHVMNGVLKCLLEDTEVSRLIREKFVFYLVPIINPDGVFRGHYRTDRNGVNLNRYYLGPSPKEHSPIFAIKKFVLHLHNNNRFFSSLDLHAHAGRKGMFIYGNYSNELKTQLQICMFPKILSMNSPNFQYQACNFTQKNMYAKDKSDTVSKEGAARVAIFKATKNPYCWTLQCNYNMNRIENQICPRNYDIINQTSRAQQNFDQDLICNHQDLNPNQQPKSYFTISTYQQLGHEILDSYLDLLEIHPNSRITNSQSRFKHIHNLKLNLLVALMKMTPYHFQSQYRKLLLAVQNEKQQIVQRGIKALYEIFVKGSQINNIQDFLRNDSLKAPQFKKRVRINRSNFQINTVKRRKTANEQLKLPEDQCFNKASQQTTNETNAEEFTLVNIKNTSKEIPPPIKQKIKSLKQQVKQQIIQQQVQLPGLSLNIISSNRRQQPNILNDNQSLEKKMREYVEKSRPEEILISNMKGMLALKGEFEDRKTDARRFSRTHKQSKKSTHEKSMLKQRITFLSGNDQLSTSLIIHKK